MTSDTPLHQLLRALVRFWWVAIVGIILAVARLPFATYHVSAGFPPKFESRAQSTYSASTQVLITSKREPYLSATNVNAKIVHLRPATRATTAPPGRTAGSADVDLRQRQRRRRRPRAPRRDRERPAPARHERSRDRAAQPPLPAHQRQRHGRQSLRLLGRRRLPLRPAAVHQDHGHGQLAPGRARHHELDRARVQELVRGPAGRAKIKPRRPRRSSSRSTAPRTRPPQGGSKPLLGVAAAAARAARHRRPRARTRPADPARRARWSAPRRRCRWRASPRSPHRSPLAPAPGPSCPRSRCRP